MTKCNFFSYDPYKQLNDVFFSYEMMFSKI